MIILTEIDFIDKTVKFETGKLYIISGHSYIDNIKFASDLYSQLKQKAVFLTEHNTILFKNKKVYLKSFKDVVLNAWRALEKNSDIKLLIIDNFERFMLNNQNKLYSYKYESYLSSLAGLAECYNVCICVIMGTKNHTGKIEKPCMDINSLRYGETQLKHSDGIILINKTTYNYISK